jgi:hypothetical protein
MATTNLSVYIPTEGELEALRAILLHKPLVLGLFKVPILPDPSTVFTSLSEMPSGSNRAYAAKELTNELIDSAIASAKWWMHINATMKAEGVYSNLPLTWTLNAYDLADGNTVYGVFAYIWVLPFTAGTQPIRKGDVIYQGTAAWAEVADVDVVSGSWGAGTAAGYITLKRKNGTFVAGATLVNASRGTATGEIKVLTEAPVAAGTGYAVGDRFKILTGTGGVGRVTAVTGGLVTAVELLSGGRDYSVATAATTKLDGAGNDGLTVAVASLHTAGPAVSIATLAGDANKKLMAVWPYAAGIPITLDGQSITFALKIALATGISL